MRKHNIFGRVIKHILLHRLTPHLMFVRKDHMPFWLMFTYEIKYIIEFSYVQHTALNTHAHNDNSE